MKNQPENLLSLLLMISIACVQGCGGPGDRSEDGGIAQEVIDALPARPLEDDPAADAYSDTGGGAALPDSGVIAAKGPYPESTTCAVDCSCSSVRLARVTTQDLQSAGSWWTFGLSPRTWHPPVVRYELGDAATPPESGPLTFPERELYDRVCFFFSFPQCDAFWRWVGDNRGCTAKVKMRWPVRNSGWREYTWQLYGVQGWQLGNNDPGFSAPTIGDFRNGTPNLVCLNVHFDGFQIPPGRGTVTWSVENRTCQPNVAFEVTPRP